MYKLLFHDCVKLHQVYCTWYIIICITKYCKNLRYLVVLHMEGLLMQHLEWLASVTYITCSMNCVMPCSTICFVGLCFYSKTMIAIFLPREEQWWVFLYESIHIYPKLSTAWTVSSYMLMYFPCICRHVHCQCIIICYNIYVSMKWKVHFCYHLQK